MVRCLILTHLVAHAPAVRVHAFFEHGIPLKINRKASYILDKFPPADHFFALCAGGFEVFEGESAGELLLVG